MLKNIFVPWSSTMDRLLTQLPVPAIFKVSLSTLLLVSTFFPLSSVSFMLENDCYTPFMCLEISEYSAPASRAFSCFAKSPFTARFICLTYTAPHTSRTSYTTPSVQTFLCFFWQSLIFMCSTSCFFVLSTALMVFRGVSSTYLVQQLVTWLSWW